MIVRWVDGFIWFRWRVMNRGALDVIQVVWVWALSGSQSLKVSVNVWFLRCWSSPGCLGLAARATLLILLVWCFLHLDFRIHKHHFRSVAPVLKSPLKKTWVPKKGQKRVWGTVIFAPFLPTFFRGSKNIVLISITMPRRWPGEIFRTADSAARGSSLMIPPRVAPSAFTIFLLMYLLGYLYIIIGSKV